MAAPPIILTNPRRREFAKLQIDNAPDGSLVRISEVKEARTDAQNRLVHRWYADASHSLVGQSPADVKAECNLTYGRPILMRDDPEWAEVFGPLFDHLHREAKLKAVRVLDIPFTRRMGVKQLTEYMDQMRRDYAELEIYLTDPELRGYAA